MSFNHGCPCGFTDPAGIRKFSRRWYELHAAAHLVAFPNLDQISRDNLAMLTRTASS